MKKLDAGSIGLPFVSLPRPRKAPTTASILEASAFARLCQTLEISRRSGRSGQHVFLILEDRHECFEAIVARLKDSVVQEPAPPDWVYVHNVKDPASPKALALPAGMGSVLKDHMAAMMVHLRQTVPAALEQDTAIAETLAALSALRAQTHAQLHQVSVEAKPFGLSVLKNSQGRWVIGPSPSSPDPLTLAPSPAFNETMTHQRTLQTTLEAVLSAATNQEDALAKTGQNLRAQVVNRQVDLLMGHCRQKFASVAYCAEWLEDVALALKDNVDRWLVDGSGSGGDQTVPSLVGVNLLVDHAAHRTPTVEVVNDATYETLFGVIPYAQGPQGFFTHHELIRSGALHRANKGVLVMRAESFLAHPPLWSYVKAALRDGQVRIEEIHKATALPVLQSLRPQPIPLEVQVVLVGSHRHYQALMEADPHFHSTFKLRAEVEPDMPATPQNLQVLRSLFEQWAQAHGGKLVHPAHNFLLSHAASLCGQRDALTSSVGLCYDVLNEALALALHRAPVREPSCAITADDIRTVLEGRRQRFGAAMARHVDEICSDRVHIATEGSVVGQVNGLTVTIGSEVMFGAPVRITARTYPSKQGVINIERDIDMSGPIQKKGVMTLMGYLNAEFGQTETLSFGCSLTFEQNYVVIDGDSASLAELLAILSALSGVPLRQDCAITGSMDQLGRVQSIGGVRAKIEGFFEVCARRGLSGQHGVVLPMSNLPDVIVTGAIEDAVRAERFHLWAVESVAEAAALMFDVPPTICRRPKGAYAFVCRKIRERLKAYAKVLAEENG